MAASGMGSDRNGGIKVPAEALPAERMTFLAPR